MSETDAAIPTREAYEADAAAWAGRWQDKGFLAHRFDRFRALLSGHARVLDAGCGPGLDAAQLRQRGLLVTGLDITRSMLAVARARGGVERVVQGDLRSLPFRDGRFDAAWASASLLHLPKSQVKQALLEVRRVLRHEGIFHSSMKAGQYDGFMDPIPGHTIKARRYFAHYQPEEWNALLRASGFEVVQQEIDNTEATPPDTPWIVTYARKSEASGEALHAIVRGRVQGVGFRLFVERQAADLLLNGWVRNLDDGSRVEVLAEGPRPALEALLERLRRGPRMALVEDVDFSWAAGTGAFDNFSVRP